MKTVAITGATGYLGAAIRSHFRAEGWRTISLARTVDTADQGDERHVYSLGEPFPADLNCDALVHVAHDFSARDRETTERINVRGSIELLKSARARGIRCVFISSLSAAAPGSIYGWAKREVETFCQANGVGVIRPGIITGPGGFYRKLQMIARLPVIPLVGRGDQPLFLVRREDVCRGVAAMVPSDQPCPPEPINFAKREPYTFRNLLSELASRAGKSPLFIPVPVAAVRAGLAVFGPLGLTAGFRLDNLNGLFLGPIPIQEEPMGLKLSAPIV
ncbi:MAG: NAD-dependent epimerase/dehydratase [Bradyrhizobium sp.]|nr:NAD-dependent epimerase/dehydratase [Bradyrhizobium sp.]